MYIYAPCRADASFGTPPRRCQGGFNPKYAEWDPQVVLKRREFDTRSGGLSCEPPEAANLNDKRQADADSPDTASRLEGPGAMGEASSTWNAFHGAAPPARAQAPWGEAHSTWNAFHMERVPRCIPTLPGPGAKARST